MSIQLTDTKAALERQICPTHHQRPTVNILGNQLQINACCDEFIASLEAKMDSNIMGQIDSAIDDIFNKMGD